MASLTRFWSFPLLSRFPVSSGLRLRRYLIEIEYHCDFVAIAILGTRDAILPDFHWQVGVLNGSETHFLEEGRRKSQSEDLCDLAGAGFFDKRRDNRTAGSAHGLVGRRGQTKDFCCAAGVLLKTSTPNDLPVDIGDE